MGPVYVNKDGLGSIVSSRVVPSSVSTEEGVNSECVHVIAGSKETTVRKGM